VENEKRFDGIAVNSEEIKKFMWMVFGAMVVVNGTIEFIRYILGK
jgi:hypothetical protein